jgi:hypothetical protein
MVSRVLIYTVDRDLDGQEQTSMKKETDRRCWVSDTVAAMATFHALAGRRRRDAPVGYL